jgi:hypothetical protein
MDRSVPVNVKEHSNKEEYLKMLYGKILAIFCPLPMRSLPHLSCKECDEEAMIA